ncbi:MAG: hypothetical protein PF692_02015 [Kiritimatiellae bacterium]|jgi:hypothetical protein|nr:hypothetical protein [Kiritimatiellia bacterium]
MPKLELEKILLTQELRDYAAQSNISKKNVLRIERITRFEDHKIVELSKILLEVAKIAPRKKNRNKILAKQNFELLKKMKTSILIFDDFLDQSSVDDSSNFIEWIDADRIT